MLDDALEHLIRGIVSHPDDVTVKDKELRRGRMLEVRVSPDDVGKVIGRAGRTATALRTVIGALAGSQDVRIDFVDVDKVARRGGGGCRQWTLSLASLAERTASAARLRSSCAPMNQSAASRLDGCLGKKEARESSRYGRFVITPVGSW